MPEKKLNSDQLAAVTHGAGPLLVIAGAGTGKTTVITERVRHLTSHGLAHPNDILCLTFTEKAAAQMEERIDIALPYGHTQLWVTTFHGFCDRVLREEAFHIGLSSGYHLLSGADSTALFKKHLFDFSLDYFRPLGNPNKFIDNLLTHFSRLQDEDITPADYQGWAKTQADDLEGKKYRELAQVFHDYSQLKISASAMDFSDLISNTLALFRARPNILQNYRRRFKYILVDEYQDTNYSQTQLVYLLAGSDPNLTIVADDDQAIYRWRGAAVSNILDFRRRYPASRVVTLTQNYRSTAEILNRAYSLIRHNNPDRLEVQEGIDKKLIPVTKNLGDPITLIHTERDIFEAEAVVQKIQQLVSSDPAIKLKDIAILVRANAHAEQFVHALTLAGIPHQFLGPSRLFDQPEIKDLIAYLKVLTNFEDNPSFYRLLSMDFLSLPARDLAVLSNLAHKTSISLFEVAEQVVAKTLSAKISDSTIRAISDLLAIIQRHLGQLAKLSAGQLIYDFLSSTGQLSRLVDYQTPNQEAQALNITKFFNRLKSFEAVRSDATAAVVLDWLELSTELGDSPLATETDWTANEAVNILTIHSAKGLEFPIVFMVNLVNLRFPSISRSEPIPVPDALIKESLPTGDYHLQEERRLFYVGMTRARSRLFFSASKLYGDGRQIKKLSPFISEALGEVNPESSPTHTIFPQISSSPAAVHTASPNSKPLALDYLTYTHIQTFLDCPLHYKARYILKLPTPPSAASSFGNSIHAAMRDLYLSSDSPDPRALLTKNWIPHGFISKKHQSAYFSRGLDYLTRYIAKYYHPSRPPLKLEEPFTVPLDGFKIGGKIDRVDALSDGSIEIIDYKTTSHPLTQKSADTDLQLSFYALAATIIPHSPFGKHPDQIKLTLYYFETDETLSTTRTADQLAQAKTEIYDFADQIRRSDFNCTGSRLCRHCDYASLCRVK